MVWSFFVRVETKNMYIPCIFCERNMYPRKGPNLGSNRIWNRRSRHFTLITCVHFIDSIRNRRFTSYLPVIIIKGHYIVSFEFPILVSKTEPTGSGPKLRNEIIDRYNCARNRRNTRSKEWTSSKTLKVFL